MTSIKIPKYNIEGKKSDSIELATQYQNLDFKADFINQMITSYFANRRQVLAHTKTRGEVRGGGKKPWRQKGTGRARVGSSRVPNWIGGGTVFGPRKNRNFTRIQTKKMRRKALAITLAKKNEEKELLVVDIPKQNEVKTKKILTWLQKLPLKEGNILISLGKIDPIIYLSTKNIPYIQNKPAKNINCLDLLQHDNILLDQEAIAEISALLGKKDNKKHLVTEHSKKSTAIKNKSSLNKHK